MIMTFVIMLGIFLYCLSIMGAVQVLLDKDFDFGPIVVLIAVLPVLNTIMWYNGTDKTKMKGTFRKLFKK